MTVADSSPLIALSRTDAFHLLRPLFGNILIPPAVFDEVVTKGRARPGAFEVRQAMDDGWMHLKSPARLLTPPYGPMRLGEVQALSLAKELGSSILLDENPARRRASIENI